MKATLIRRMLPCWFALICLNGLPAQAQIKLADTLAIITLYDRCLDFPASKADSMQLYANDILVSSAIIQYPMGELYGTRLIGIANELKGQYDKALQQYLKLLELANKRNDPSYIVTALSDMAILYTEGLNQPEKSKEVYKEILRVQRNNNIPASVSLSTYVNLGAIYTRLKQYDSSLIILNLGLREALVINDVSSLSSIYNNIGNIYYQKGDYKRALEYFQRNYQQHVRNATAEEIWLDYLNMGDSWLALHELDSAKKYLSQALQQAQANGDALQLKESYSLLAKLHYNTKEYAKAFDWLQKTYDTDTSLLNIDTRNTIATLQEQFNAAEREKANQLLLINIEKAKLQNRIYLSIALSALLIGAAIAYAWFMKRKANQTLTELNETITQQNQRLTTLNFEKNKLMSMVSHDLSTPFASVRMWAEVLRRQYQQPNQTDADPRLPDQQGAQTVAPELALNKILDSAQRGESLIQQILQVEKMETGKQALELEEIQFTRFIAHLMEDFENQARSKQITLSLEAPEQPVLLLTDRKLIERIFQNLVSNALKFTPSGKQVWVRIQETPEQVVLEVADEGPGIEGADIRKLFTPYGQLSARPTAGESSTGLGLSIVKRLVEELQGKVSCQSTPGVGCTFVVELPR